jgi:hypothetical protein
MGELAARHRARDLWISRSHVGAALTGAIVLSLTTFAMGYTLGRSDAPPAAPVVLADATRDDALVELLARVEATAAADGGASALTFPDALKGGAGSGEPLDLGPTDAAPAGRYTVVVASSTSRAEAEAVRERLRAAGLEAWMRAELVGGKPRWRVAVGGHPTEEAAAEAMPAIVDVGVGRPVVAPL